LAIYVDSSGNVYVAGDTTSTNFLGSIGSGHAGFQASNGGGIDGWLAKLNTGEGVNVVYVTYLGGTGTDIITAVTADSNGVAYVTGRTNSTTGFPIFNATNLFPTYGGGNFDAFLTQISADGTTPYYSTYLGGPGDDEATGIALDPDYIAYYSGAGPLTAGGTEPRAASAHQKVHADLTSVGGGGVLYSPLNVYVTGSTDNANEFFQTASGSVTNLGGKDAFVVKIGLTQASPILYSKFFGGSGDDLPNGIMVDLSGNAYVVGSTNSPNFPTFNPVQETCGGGCAGGVGDAFLTRLNPEGASLVFSSYLGGTGADTAAGVAQDVNAGTWLTGSTASTDFPTVDPFQPTHGNDSGNTDVFVADITGVSAIRNLPGFTSTVFPANDDGSAGPVVLGANFNNGNGINFFAKTYTGLYVNNNGNITFDTICGTYTPTGLTTPLDCGYGVTAVIAPYWADVETTGQGSGLLTYGNDTVNGHNAFGVNWINAGYYAYPVPGVDKLDSFQAVLVDRQDIAPGDFDIEFNYAKIQWEAGDASDGFDGLGGESAHVGYSNGTGNPGTYFELPGSGINGAFLDSNTATGLIYGGNGPVLGRLTFQVRGGQVVQQGFDVAVTQTHTPDPVAIGGTLTFNITVTDNGPGNAGSVNMQDALPTNVTLVSATPSQGSCSGNPVVLCTLGTINNGDSATIVLVVTVNSGPTVTSTAVVATPNPDSNPANNTSTTVANVETGTAPIAVLMPTTLTYQHNLNLQCPSKALIVSNTGGSALQIFNISATGNFAITGNACPSSLGPGLNCEVDVSFTAEAPTGMYGGSVTITDNAATSPQVVPLSGQVFPPCLMQSDTTTEQILRSTPSTTFNIRDTQPSCHTTTTTMSCANSLQATCSFSPAAIAPGGSTVLTVQNLNALTTDNLSFTAEGADKTNTTGVNLQVLLSDFTYTPASTTATVTAGQTASYALTLTPVNGLSGVVNLACQGAPAGSTCSVAPASVTLTQNYPAQITVTVSTAGRSMGAPRGSAPLQGPGAAMRLWLELASLLALLGLAVWGATGTRRSRWQNSSLAFRRLRLSALALAALALMVMAWAACGGGGNVASVPSITGTPAGTYALTVTGTFTTSSGQATGLTRTESLSLQVN
jgi:uncharacterized repeat protein (TIGR01451 family)